MNIQLNSENKFDNEIKSLPNIKWLPWIGKNFIDTQVLILGESHYEDGHYWQDSDSTTRIILNKRLSGNKVKLYSNFERIILTKKDLSIEEINKFWSSLCYYNLVQRLMNSIKERPNKDDFDSGWNIFFNLIEVISPKVCIVLGKSSFGRLGFYLKNNNQFNWNGITEEFYDDKKIIHLTKEEKELTLIFINHPSGSRGFSCEYWTDFINKNEPEVLNLLNKVLTS